MTVNELIDFEESKVSWTFGRNTFEKVFLWAVLKVNHELSKALWKLIESPMAASLIANTMYKDLQPICVSKVQVKELRVHAAEYDQLAIEVLDALHKAETKNKYVSSSSALSNFWTSNMAIDMLNHKLPGWGNNSCMNLAFQTKNQQFIAQGAFQEFLTGNWMGKMNKDVSFVWVFLGIFLFPIVRLRVNFFKASPEKMMFCSEGLERPFKRFVVNFIDFYTSPIIKFILTVMFHVSFLVLFSYYLLVVLAPETVWLDWLLIIWVFDYLLYEGYQMLHPDVPLPPSKHRLLAYLKLHLKDKWNILDFLACCLFIIGFIVRLFACTRCMEAARVMLALAFIIFSLRVLHFFTISEQLGPKVVMVKRMLKDMFLFVIILSVFIVSYAIASESILYPNSQLSWMFFLRLPRRAYFTIYGDNFLDDVTGDTLAPCTNDPTLYNDYQVDRCPSELGKYMVPVLLVPYMLLTSVLLLNLLIAMFNHSFMVIQNDPDAHWCYPNLEIQSEFIKKPPLCPPFFFVYLFFYLPIHFCVQKSKTKYLQLSTKVGPTSDIKKKIAEEHQRSQTRKLLSWETETFKNYVKSMEKQKMKSDSNRLCEIQAEIFGENDEEDQVEETENHTLSQKVKGMEKNINHIMEKIDILVSALGKSSTEDPNPQGTEVEEDNTQRM